MLLDFSVSKETNNVSQFCIWEMQIFNFPSLNNLDSLRLATIEFPTISVVPGFHSSVLVVLLVLLVVVDISDFVVGSICGISDDLINM